MALYSKVHCENCGSEFEVYNREMQMRGTPIRCPHCLQQMTRKQWAAFVDAFFTVQDLNYQALKAHEEHRSPLFTVEMVYKRIPREIICVDDMKGEESDGKNE